VLRAMTLTQTDAWNWMDKADACLEEIRRAKALAGEDLE
jgi:hypothetical protein